ncbi:lantibiotic dehydratase [Streptomyces sp. NPDC001127]|uniref:lantibiotic dehydratase n=1 Tax=Streptomyces sp. NPDC001127 TaxID=3154377 RepID=UPI003319930B
MTETRRPGDTFILRIAGAPIETMRGLRSPRSAAWAAAVLEREEELLALGAHVSDLLHDVVKQTEDTGARRALVELRRQVFNNRLPRDTDAVRGLAAALEPAPARLVTEWLATRLALEDLHTEGEETVRTELGAARAHLAGLAGDAGLRKALLLASPSLDTYLHKYVRKHGGKLGKSERRIERSLVEYLSRMACKTSPFSTFTGLALGRFTDGDSGPRRTAPVDGWSSHPRLNIVVLGRIADLITENDTLRLDLPVRLTAGWRLDDLDRIRYVRRTVTTGDDDATVSFDTVRDSLFFLRKTGTLDRVFTITEAHPDIRYGDLLDRLSEETGIPALEYDRYVAVLLRLGLLQVPSLHLDLHSHDPLRAFRDQLDGLEYPWARSLAAQLNRPAEALDAYRVADVAGRRQLLAAVRQDLLRILSDLGASDATLPVTLVYEDCSAGREPVLWNREEWQHTFGDALEALSRVFPAFDSLVCHRLTLKGFFVSRFGRGGRCDDVLSLVHDFHEDIYHQYSRWSGRYEPFEEDGTYVPQSNWMRLPEITSVDKGRQLFARRIHELAGGSEADEVRIGEEIVDEVAAELACITPDFRPRSWFLQLGRDAGGPLAVLNRSYSGLSFPFSRFTHCFDAPGTEEFTAGLRASMSESCPPDAVFAEITGGIATTNLNLHGRLTPYVIVCPGESTSAPEECRIPLADLYVVHCNEQDRVMLRSRRLDKEVIPVYLGYLFPLALPEIPRILTLFSPTPMMTLDIWGGVPEQITEGGVAVRPRVRYRNVVVARRRWTVAAEALPKREPEATDAGWFLQWRRWQRTHDLPDQVFATVDHRTAHQDETDPGAWRGQSKPHYVDFTSHLSLTALESLLKRNGERVVFREMLPAEDDLDMTSSVGRHVTEYVVEVN